jgi:hypothetical protein
VLTRQGTSRQRQRVFAIFVAVIVVGATGCVVRDKAEGVLNRTDRDNFTSSAESCTKAERAYVLAVTASNASADHSGFAAAAQGPIDAMKHATAQMGALADKVKGNAHTIATTLWQAASGVVSAAERLVFATSARDNDLVDAANTDAHNSVEEYNKQREASNAR